MPKTLSSYLACIALGVAALLTCGCAIRIPPCPPASLQMEAPPVGLENKVVLEGEVVDDHGRPVIGAVIGIWERSPGFRQPEFLSTKGFLIGAATDIDGRFSIAPMAPRESLWVTIEACRLALDRPVRVEVKGPCTVRLKIQLCPCDKCPGGTFDGPPIIDMRSTSD